MSLPLSHIACCVDPSEASEMAIIEALPLRRRAPGRLSLVYVAPPREVLAGGLTEWEIDAHDPLGPPRRWLEERAGAIEGAEPVLLCGDPAARVVTEWMPQAGVDLVVAAAYHDRVQRAFLGSFARQLAYDSPCHVLIARPSSETGDARTRHVGCCIDESAGAARALALTQEVVELTPAHVSMVHVVSPPPPLPRRLVARLFRPPGARRRQGQALLRQTADQVPGAEQVLLTGAPGPAACAWAEEARADLLVVGPRAGGRAGLGGFASHVVTAAPCAVLLARPDR